jgi:hypothetical protein
MLTFKLKKRDDVKIAKKNLLRKEVLTFSGELLCAFGSILFGSFRVRKLCLSCGRVDKALENKHRCYL